jgi:hypothetical protein
MEMRQGVNTPKDLLGSAIHDGCDLRAQVLFSRDKRHVETVTCFMLTAKHAEWSGELWARRWVDLRGGT